MTTTLAHMPIPVPLPDIVTDPKAVDFEGAHTHDYIAHFMQWLRNRAAVTNKPYTFVRNYDRITGQMTTVAGNTQTILELYFTYKNMSYSSRRKYGYEQYIEMRLKTIDLVNCPDVTWTSKAGRFKRVSSVKAILDEHLFNKVPLSALMGSIHMAVCDTLDKMQKQVQERYASTEDWFALNGKLFADFLVQDRQVPTDLREQCTMKLSYLTELAALLEKNTTVVVCERDGVTYSHNDGPSWRRVINPLPNPIIESIALLRLNNRPVSSIEGVGAQVRGNGITAFAVLTTENVKRNVYGCLEDRELD